MSGKKRALRVVAALSYLTETLEGALDGPLVLLSRMYEFMEAKDAELRRVVFVGDTKHDSGSQLLPYLLNPLRVESIPRMY